MKNRISIIFMTVFFCLLTACSIGEAEKQTGESIEIYYLNKENTKVESEEYILQGSTESEVLDEVMSLMQKPAQNVELKPPISEDFRVKSYYVEEEQAVLDVDEHYKEMEPTKEVLTRAAIVRTLTQIPTINFVSIKVNGEPLTDMSGNLVGTMTEDIFIDNAGTEINSYEKAKLRLYFANETGERLVEVNRTLVYNSNISLEKLVVEQIIAGPTNQESYPTVNPNTKIVSVTVKDGTCYVNLDEAFLTLTYNVTSDVTIYSIVNSLIELSNVNRVQILISGKSDIIYREKTNFMTVFERNLELLK